MQLKVLIPIIKILDKLSHIHFPIRLGRVTIYSFFNLIFNLDINKFLMKKKKKIHFLRIGNHAY